MMNRLAIVLDIFELAFIHGSLDQSHHDIATKNGADSAPFHSLFTGIIRAGCNVAIKIAERI